MGIDPTYYEAAMVDGANKWQQIKNVTIPQILPMMSVLLIFKHRRYLQSRLWFVLHRTKKLRCALQRDKCVRYLYLQWLNGYW